MTQAPTYLDEIAPQPASQDKLDRLRDKAREARDLKQLAADLEERRKAANNKLNDLLHRELPQLFAEAMVDSVGVRAEGNHPAYNAVCRPYYKAAISAEWEPERRAAGFEFLREHEAGDLIKNVVVVSFGRGEEWKAADLCAWLRQSAMSYERSMDVSWNTLTAWLKEQIGKYHADFSQEELEKIGAKVGAVVELKPVRG